MEQVLLDSLTLEKKEEIKRDIEVFEAYEMTAKLIELKKRFKSIHAELCDLYQYFNKIVDEFKENFDEDLLSHCNLQRIDANFQEITEDTSELKSDILDLVHQMIKDI